MISDPQPWCPNGWAATESSPSCNYTGGHYCVRLAALEADRAE